MKTRRRYFKSSPSKNSAQPSRQLSKVTVTIERLSHDGRGISRYQGKTLFVAGALPGEEVVAEIFQQRSKFAEGRCVEVITPSAERCEPLCPHYNQCGGCELQHLKSDNQISFKQEQAFDQLQRISGIQPEQIMPALDDSHWHYRRRARISIYCPKKNSQPVMGFRRRQSKLLTPIQQCPVLDQKAEALIPKLSSWIAEAEKPQSVSHIELMLGDDDAALVLRHPLPLAEKDRDQLAILSQEAGFDLYLQPEGHDSMTRFSPAGETLVGETLVSEQADRLHYSLDDFNLKLAYHPSDFTQVNSAINRKMVIQALDWLSPTKEDRILDLFAGLGNFTLPLAKQVKEVIAIEGSERMVQRGQENASANRLDNAQFYKYDLTKDFRHAPWFQQGFNKILLDPPRAGALEVVTELANYGAEKILYVSCDPATFARDAKVLIQQGYRLTRWGVMNMFPQTTHVESMGLFER